MTDTDFDDFALSAADLTTLENALIAAGFAAREAETNENEGTVKGRFVAAPNVTAIRAVFNDDAVIEDDEVVADATVRFAAYACLRLASGQKPPAMDGVDIFPWEPGLPGWG